MEDESLAAREEYEEQTSRCRLPLQDPRALWRKGVLSDAVVEVGDKSVPIHSQFFINGSRTCRRFFTLLRRSKLPEDAEGRLLLKLDPPFNSEAPLSQVKNKLAASFEELHEFVMVGEFAPQISTATASLCLSRYLEMTVESDYMKYITETLSAETAVALMYDSYLFGFKDVLLQSQKMVAANFVLYRAREFHAFTVEVLSGILELPDLVPGAAHTVCDCIHSYVLYRDEQRDALGVDDFHTMTHPLEEKYDINPEHCIFFILHIQNFEKLITEPDSFQRNRFGKFLGRLETVLAQNFYSTNPQDYFQNRVDIVAAVLLNKGLRRKGEYDVSNCVSLYLKEHQDLSLSEFFEIARVLDDFPISSEDVIFFTNRLEHYLQLCDADSQPKILRILSQILSTCLNDISRFIRQVNLVDFSMISLESLKDILSRDALQSHHEDLVFQLIASYIERKGSTLTEEDIVGLWKTCRLHLLSSECYALAFQDPTLPKHLLAAALIHHKRKLSGDFDERKSEFDSYAKSQLVLRPRLSLEELDARRKEDDFMLELMGRQMIDSKHVSPVMRLFDDHLKIECVDPDNKHSKGTALCVEPIEISRGGIFSFEVRIDALPEEYWEILVGVCEPNHDLDSWVGSSDTSWSYLALHSGSRIYHNSVCDQYNEKEILKVGDQIGVSLDCTDKKTGVLSFIVNGVDKGAAFDGIGLTRLKEEDKKISILDSEEDESEPNTALAMKDQVSEINKKEQAGDGCQGLVFPALSLSRRNTIVSIGKFKWRRH